MLTHQHPYLHMAVWRGTLRFTMRPLPVRVRLIGPPAGPSCCPSSSSDTLLLGGDALLTSQQMAFCRTNLVWMSMWKTRANVDTVAACLPLDIREEAGGINPAAALTFTQWERAGKTFAEVGWRNRGEPWSVEGSLTSLQTTQDTVVSFDTPDSKDDL